MEGPTQPGDQPSRTSRRRLVRRLTGIAVAACALVVVCGYAYGANAAFDQATSLDRKWCESTFGSNSPASFRTNIEDTTPYVDTTKYEMPAYETVSIPSRDSGITLSGWWIPASQPASTGTASSVAPAIVVVHGRGKCKRDPEVLLPAGMLHNVGRFSILLIDARNHGASSDANGGRFTWGTTEYRDVLGAWDWLRTAKSIPANRIGLYGVSFGAASVTIAMGEEPRIAAVWEDSGWSDTDELFKDLARRQGYPDLLEPGAVAIGRVFYGTDLTALSPGAAVGRLDGRPYFIVHGDADSKVNVKQAFALAAVIRAHSGRVEPWIVGGANHVRAAFVATAEYERRLVAFFRSALETGDVHTAPHSPARARLSPAGCATALIRSTIAWASS